MSDPIQFSTSRFNRIFPYFIRMDENLLILNTGDSLAKLIPGCKGKKFFEIFELIRPQNGSAGMASLKELEDQLLVLAPRGGQLQLRGQLELLSQQKEWIFLGSPWFTHIDGIPEHGLQFSDFAIHDPTIDLLHLLKTHEITNDDLKSLLNSIDRQKQELKRTAIEYEKLALVASSNKNGVLFTDPTGKISWVNESLQRMTGYPASDMIGKTPIEIFRGPKTDGNTLRQMVSSFHTGEPFDVHLIFYRPQGEPFWGECKGQPIMDPLGKVLQYFTIIEDITASKQLEEAVRNNEQKYRDIITNMNLGLLEVDLQENITFANRSFCDMSGYSFEELEGKNASDLFVKADGKQILQQKNELRKLGISDVYEVSIYNKQGEKKWWMISATPRYDNKKQLTGSIGIHLDITAQKNLEHDLIESREKARHLARTKEAFLANMSHEIRTPMNAIMGLGNQLAKSSLNREQMYFLEMIQHASQHLLVIINDILDLTKIEAGKLNMEYIGFEPARLLRDTMQVLKHKAEEKGILLREPKIDPHCASILLGDPYRLTQVINNMLGNAIKFTEDGEVEVSLSVIKEDQENQALEFLIKDTGIGMDPAFLKTIFESFSQEDESISRKFGGTGLGMTISKQLIELMGGQIQISSEKGIGTVAAIQIEFKKGNPADLPELNSYQPSAHILLGKKILVVDDNDLNRLVVTKLLQDHDAIAIEATNGMEAIARVQLNEPDMVLMDLQMPVLNGLDASRMIRNLGYDKPIIAVTANAIKGESGKCYDAGMNDYITKPFRENELMQKVECWLNNGIPSPPQRKATPEVIATAKEDYDLSGLQALAGGDNELLDQMIRVFCEQTAETIRLMKEARAKEDRPRLGRLAHKIKPDIDSLQIDSLKEEIRLLEKAGKNQLAFELIDPLLETIHLKSEKIMERLRSKTKKAKAENYISDRSASTVQEDLSK